ncbi:MAG: hypothetical protein SFX73_02305 [Kofleriaceae bacterium]|nr:hypothetical protein [Kofleriaceae bacterium]
MLLVVACATPAFAQPLPAPATDEDDGAPFVFAAGHVGLNAPFGVLGFELGAGIDFLRGSLSVGRGFRGVSVAAMGRAVKEVGAFDLGIGIGVSRGPGQHWPATDDEGHRIADSDFDPHYGADSIWLDFELSAEAALAGAGFMRVYAGVTDPQYVACVAEHRFTDDKMGCDGAQAFELAQESFLPYVGMSIGVRWPPAPASKARYTPPTSLGGLPLLPPPIPVW